MKKTFGSIFIALLLLTLVAGAAFATTSEKQVRFQGSFHEVENDEVLFPTIYVHGNGSGSANDLGQFTSHLEAIVHNDANGVGTAVGGTHVTAANGDIIFAVLWGGQGAPTNTPGVNKIVEVYTITGGTGRYANASGSITVQRLLNLPTGISDGTIEGKIKLH